MKINQAQWQRTERVGICPIPPVFSQSLLQRYLPQALYLTPMLQISNIAAPLQRTKNDRQHQTLFTEKCFKVSNTGVLISPQPDQEGNKLGNMSGTHAISTTSRRELSSIFFFPAMQGAEGNSRHSDRNLELCSLTLWPWSWTFTVQHTMYVQSEYFMNQEG